jgi:hypothetical protein
MTTRPLIIDDALRFDIDRVLLNAEAYHYIPGPGVQPPGDDDRFVVRTDFGYKIVFSLTESDGSLWRHMSISVPGRHYPNPLVVFEVATLFGFTGWDFSKGPTPAPDWLIHLDDKEECIKVAQIAPVETRH